MLLFEIINIKDKELANKMLKELFKRQLPTPKGGSL